MRRDITRAGRIDCRPALGLDFCLWLSDCRSAAEKAQQPYQYHGADERYEDAADIDTCGSRPIEQEIPYPTADTGAHDSQDHDEYQN